MLISACFGMHAAVGLEIEFQHGARDIGGRVRVSTMMLTTSSRLAVSRMNLYASPKARAKRVTTSLLASRPGAPRRHHAELQHRDHLERIAELACSPFARTRCRRAGRAAPRRIPSGQAFGAQSACRPAPWCCNRPSLTPCFASSMRRRDRDGVDRQRQPDGLALEVGVALDLGLARSGCRCCWPDAPTTATASRALEHRLDQIGRRGVADVDIALVELLDLVLHALAGRRP